MPEFRALIIIALLAGSPVAAQSFELMQDHDAEPVLGARIRSNTVLDATEMEFLAATSINTLNECTSEESVDVLSPTQFRFTDGGEEAACAYVALPVFLPTGVETMTVQFAADRLLIPTVDQPVSPPRFVQELHVLNEDFEVLDQVEINDPASSGDTGAKDYSFIMRVPSDASFVYLAFYFEDSQFTSNSAPVPASSPAWRSTVWDPRLSFQPFPVTFESTHLPDEVIEEQELVVHRFTTTVTLQSQDLYALTRILELDVLAQNQLDIVTLPGDRNRSPDELLVSTIGGTTTYAVPSHMVENPGQYTFLFHTTTALVVNEPVPATIFPLAWVGILLPFAFGMVATVHHEVFRRTRVVSQDGDWYRMLITLSAMWIGYLLLVAVWAINGRVSDMATLPINSLGILYWSAIAMAIVLFSVHLLIGSIRRRNAHRMRHEEELQQRNVQLERSNRELEQFAFMAAHDLQEPLRKVIGYTNLLQHRYQGKLDKKADGYIDQASHQAERMRRLITDVLAFSRIDQDVDKTTMDLDDIYKELQSDVPDELRKTGVRFTGKGLGKAYGNHDMVRQLMENLIGNGIKYGRPKVKPQIHIESKDLGDAVQISVRDNGLGIEAAYQERVFSMFERLHGSQSKFQGTGIGLTICQKIVEVHGGRIWVESTPGKGSTFFFTLPHGGPQ